MGRRIRKLPFWISLLLAFAAAMAWGLSYWASPKIHTLIGGRTGWQVFYTSVDGSLNLNVRNNYSDPINAPTPSNSPDRKPSDDAAYAAWLNQLPPGITFQFMGLQFRRSNTFLGVTNSPRYLSMFGTISWLTLPYWQIVVLFSILPAIYLLRFKERRRADRIRRGLCGECGYDLRASPDRCPECGAVPPVNNLQPQ